jgi:hypothetical protein
MRIRTFGRAQELSTRTGRKIVDIIHVIEYLWKAGRAFHPKSGPELEKWVQYRLLKILEGKARRPLADYLEDGIYDSVDLLASQKNWYNILCVMLEHNAT